MKRACVVIALVACGGDAKSPSTEPLEDTKLDLVLDDGTKPPKLDGRAFAVPSNGELAIYVFDAKAPEPTCTDVNVGGWMEKLGGGSAAVVRAARFSGGRGKLSASSIAHVHGGAGGKYALRSASAKGVSVDVTRYEHVFEATISGKGASGTVSGIVCAGAHDK
jgi:hypothetical protein